MSNIIYVENFDRINEFISLTNKEYFDVFLSKDNALFITNSVEVFGSLKLRAKCDDEISFRLDRALFGRLIVEGLVSVENGDDVKLIFQTPDGNELYSMQCAKQITYSGDYEEKIRILTSVTREMYVDIGEIHDLCRLCRMYKSIISVANGFACVHVNGNGRIYKSVKCTKSYAITADKLALLLKLSDRAFYVNDYVGVYSNGLYVLVRTCHGFANDDFFILNEQKAAFICKINLVNVFVWLSRVQLRADVLSFDFVRREVSVKFDNYQLSVPLYTKDERKTEKYQLGTIDIPVNVLKDYLAKLNSPEVIFKKKLNFNQIEANGIYFFI